MNGTSLNGQSITEIVHELERRQFYGSLELKFEAGRVVLLRKSETIKPNNNYRTTRGEYIEQK